MLSLFFFAFVNALLLTVTMRRDNETIVVVRKVARETKVRARQRSFWVGDGRRKGPYPL